MTRVFKNQFLALNVLLMVLIAPVVSLSAEPFAKIDAWQADLERLKTETVRAGVGIESIMHSSPEWVANIRSARYQQHDDGLPSLKEKPVGEIGIIPLKLALIYLSGLEGNIDTARKTRDGLSEPALSPPGQPTHALVIRQGRLTLSQLAEAAALQFPDALNRTPDGIIAKWPLFIWSDAELVLENGDRLILAGASKSFIINAGLLRLDTASISSVIIASSEPASPRPFIATVMSGAMQVRKSEISGLGVSGFAQGYGIIISGSPIAAEIQKTYLTGNTFRDAGVFISNSTGINITRNRFVDTRLASLKLESVSNANVRSNIFANTNGEFSIGIGGASLDVNVASNIMIGGSGNGIFVNKGGSSIRIASNLVSGRGKSGIVINGATCVEVAYNIVIGNHENGIGVSRSVGVSVVENRIIRNGRSGVFVRAQGQNAVTVIERNVFTANGSGLDGQASSTIEIADNDLTEQLPILVAGDFSGGLRQILSHKRPGERLTLTSGVWASKSNDADLAEQSVASNRCKARS